MNFFFLGLLLRCSSGFGAIHHEGTLSSVNLGIRYSSVLVKRGMIFYEDFQIDPVLGVFLFDDRVEFLGDSLGFRDFVSGDQIRLRTRLQALSDNPLFPALDSIKKPRDRTDTYEWINTAEFFLPGYNDNYSSEIDLSFAKDVSVHWGHYFEILAKFKIFDFRIFGTLLEPNLVGSFGYGDAAHNGYLYGPAEAKLGPVNSTVGVWVAFPEQADRFYPILQIMKFSTQGLNQNSQGYLFSFIATIGLLE